MQSNEPFSTPWVLDSEEFDIRSVAVGFALGKLDTAMELSGFDGYSTTLPPEAAKQADLFAMRNGMILVEAHRNDDLPELMDMVFVNTEKLHA